MDAITADRIVMSDAVFTANTLEASPGFVAIKGDTILAVGAPGEEGRFIGPDTLVEDFEDALVMPGFNDSHMHFALASAQKDEDFCVDVEGCRSEEEALGRIRRFATANPDNPWIYGWGWDSSMWESKKDPTKAELDAISTERPICISHFTMHTSWCNSKALELAGITRDTPDPEGGIIGRDESGELTGVLYEHPASHLVADLPLNVPDLAKSIRKRLAAFAQLGITAIGDMFPRDVTNDDVYETYRELEEDGALTCRITFFPSLLDLDEVIEMRETYSSDRLRIGGVKQIMDGIIETHTALMQKPYENDGSNCGDLVIDLQEFERLLERADAHGIAVRTHCIGDESARLVLNAHEQTQLKNGFKGLRNCIEHAETVTDEDIERMARLGVCASVQPLHATFGSSTGEYQVALGEERANRCWRFRNLLDAKVHVGISTDFPACAMVEPLQVIYAATTRCMPDGFPEGGFNRSYALTLGEVLQCMTLGSAYVESFDQRIGSLERGKLADLIVLDRNLFAVDDPRQIQEARVLLTLVGGHEAYRA